MFETGKDPKALVEEKGLVQISDTGELETIIQEILDANPGPVEDYRAGKKQAKGFLVGQSMKATKGKANPKVVQEILGKLLDS
jgi:aspartyl-tRNA(Asn)/glutamyl-tRNA(Gln) amidotransferase subunit B